MEKQYFFTNILFQCRIHMFLSQVSNFKSSFTVFPPLGKVPFLRIILSHVWRLRYSWRCIFYKALGKYRKYSGHILSTTRIHKRRRINFNLSRRSRLFLTALVLWSMIFLCVSLSRCQTVTIHTQFHNHRTDTQSLLSPYNARLSRRTCVRSRRSVPTDPTPAVALPFFPPLPSCLKTFNSLNFITVMITIVSCVMTPIRRRSQGQVVQKCVKDGGIKAIIHTWRLSWGVASSPISQHVSHIATGFDLPFCSTATLQGSQSYAKL